MGKLLILIAIITILLIGCSSAIAGKAFNQLLPEQKQFYWKCLNTDGCSTLLKDKQYAAYRSCSLNCNEKASNYSLSQGWCKDSDSGADYQIKGIVTTNLEPTGKEDYCNTFSDGKEYLMEGACSGNKYIYYQKNCKEIGGKYQCGSGVCFLPNQAPVLNPIGDKEVNEGEELSFEVTATDENGDELTYSAEGLPEGAVFEEGVFTWTPSYEQAGEYEVTFKVGDGEFEANVIIKLIVENTCDAWEKTFGGSDYDMAYSIQQTADGGYIVAGDTYSKSVGQSDIWILKLDSNGNLEWDKAFGGSDYDEARSIQQTIDGGYIVAGWTKSKGVGDYDGWVLKLDPNGELEWDKTFGGSDEDSVYSIQQTMDGGYIAAGFTFSESAGVQDVWIFKLDSDGKLEWDKTFGGSDGDVGHSIQQTVDSGYIVAGVTNSKGAGAGDAWILKLNEDGDLEWDKTIGWGESDLVYSVQQTTDGGYVAAGDTKSNGAGIGDAWIFKLGSSGDLEWDKTFGEGGSDAMWSIQQTIDGKYIVAGTTNSKGAGKYDAWILKLDSEGGLEWDKTFGGGEKDQAKFIQQTTDLGFIVGGYTPSKGAGLTDAWILKLDSKGNLECK